MRKVLIYGQYDEDQIWACTNTETIQGAKKGRKLCRFDIFGIGKCLVNFYDTDRIATRSVGNKVLIWAGQVSQLTGAIFT